MRMNPDTKVFFRSCPHLSVPQKEQAGGGDYYCPVQGPRKETDGTLDQACVRSICIYSCIRPKRYHLMLICAEG